MSETEEAPGNSGDWIFFVVDMGHVRVGIDVVCEGWIANLKK
jgi:hypothetical protein